jgi:hypothetical protein
MDGIRMDMKFCEQDHRTKDTETIWNEFTVVLIKSADLKNENGKKQK